MAKLNKTSKAKKAPKGKVRKSLGKGTKAFLIFIGMTIATLFIYGAIQILNKQLILAKTQDVGLDLEIDGTGTPSGPFKEPWGVATDADGNFYVTEFSGHRFRKFNPSGSEVLSVGSLGKEEGQFNQPSGIYVDPQGVIYVSDTFNYRIQKFSADGQFIKQWNHSFNGAKGIGGFGNRIYVVDTGNHKVQVFDTEGNFLKEWGGFGTSDGKFREPEGCTIDPNGFIYVVDSDNLRIQKFDLEGKLKDVFRVSTWRGKNDEMPYLAIAQGAIFTTNASQKWVLKYSATGSVLGIYKKPGKDMGFDGAAGLAIDNQGRAIVVERGTGKVARFPIPPSTSNR
jgi:DNA-binding beta-propeller fold protein YncE